jgi:hypothetical protein
MQHGRQGGIRALITNLWKFSLMIYSRSFNRFILISLALSLSFVTVSSQAATVTLDPGDNTIAIGIKGLTVLGTTYDVTFPVITGKDLYDAPPYDFTFDNAVDAGKATVAVIDLLNLSTATRTNGPSRIWKIGYSFNDRPGTDGDRIDATEGESDGTVGGWLFFDKQQVEVGVAISWAEFNPATAIPAVPVPAAVWLFGTALLGFVGMSRRRKVA